MAKLIAFTVFCFFLLSTCFCSTNFITQRGLTGSNTGFSAQGSGSGSASAGSNSASGSASGGLAGTLGGLTGGGLLGGLGGVLTIAQPVLGIVGMPLQYIGVVTHIVDGVLGAQLPAVSIVAQLSTGNVLNLGSSSIAANAFIQNGATVNINITLPGTSGILRVVASTGLLQPILSLVGDLLNVVSNLLNGITGSLGATLQIGNNLGIFCQAAPGCTVSLKAIALNGIKISEDLTLLGSSSLINSQASVSIVNSLLSGEGVVLSAQLSVNCPVGQVVNSITGCNFLFGLLGGATGGLLGGGLLG